MHERRFFVKRNSIEGEHVLMGGRDALHISESLRLRSGDTVTVLDGEGTEYEVLLEEVSSRSVRGRVMSAQERKPVVNARVALFNALPKGAEKVKFVLRRGTEIGLSDIGFFSSARSVPRISGSEQCEEKLDRWRRIATDAAKQCRRVTVPEIRLFEGIPEMLDYCRGYPLILVAWEEEKRVRLRDVMKDAGKVGSVAVIIGPEGGFETSEIRLAEEHGGAVFSMGKNVLRSEFAGIAAATMILYELGELG
jgi:16S rRNA (uracil1498-N3)-methyltransferase